MTPENQNSLKPCPGAGTASSLRWRRPNRGSNSGPPGVHGGCANPGLRALCRSAKSFWTLEFEHALALNPDYPMAHSGLGVTMALCVLNRRDPAELEIALKQFAPRRGTGSRSRRTLPWLCYTHIRRSETALAIEAGRTGVSLLPDLPQAHYFLSLAYLVTCEEGAQNYQPAVNHLLRAMQVGPHWHPSLFVISYIALLTGDYDHAVDFAGRLIEKSKLPGLPFLGAEIVVGSALYRQGNRTQARNVLNGFVEQTPNSEHMYRDAMTAIGDCVLGELEIREGNFDTALALFRRAWHTLQEHPRINAHARISARVQAGVAAGHAALGRRDQAVAALAKALDLTTGGIPVGFAAAAASLPELYLSLAAAQVRVGDLANVGESVRRAIGTGWRDAYWLQQDPELAPLRDAPSFISGVAEIRSAPRVRFGPAAAAAGGTPAS
jgi:tetratricopeptide (TPR) repeat protein